MPPPPEQPEPAPGQEKAGESSSVEAVSAKDKDSWAELTPAEQAMATELGWDAEVWDSGEAPAAVDCNWAALPEESQGLAAALGYDGTSWDSERAGS